MMSENKKSSGVEWIGDIPDNWTINRIGQIYSERREKVSDEDYPPLSVTMQGVIPQLSNVAKSNAHDDRKLVKKGDFVINSRSDRRGSCGIAPRDGSVSLINTVLNPREVMNPQYYNWLFHTSIFAEEYYKWGHGIVNDLWTTNWSDMKNIVIPEPPLTEQEKIAKFLEASCTEIDSLIKCTKSSIEEYKKQKQALITDIVLHGLMKKEEKDSGIEWIGSVSVDSLITRVGRLCFVTKLAGFEFTKDMAENINTDEGVPIVRAQNVKMGRFINEISEFIPLEVSQKLNRCALDKKCILITFIGAGIGEVALFSETQRYHLAPNVAKIVVNEDAKAIITEEFLLYYLMSYAGQEEVNRIKKATAQPSLSMETIRSIKIVVPKTIEEQNEIVNFLNKKCADIDNVIKKKELFVAELEKYRRIFIYEYVTGKREV